MELDVLNGGKLFINKFRPIMWIENQRVFPNKLNKLLLKSGYALYYYRIYSILTITTNQILIISQIFVRKIYYKFQTKKSKDFNTDGLI